MGVGGDGDSGVHAQTAAIISTRAADRPESSSVLIGCVPLSPRPPVARRVPDVDRPVIIIYEPTARAVLDYRAYRISGEKIIVFRREIRRRTFGRLSEFNESPHSRTDGRTFTISKQNVVVVRTF